MGERGGFEAYWANNPENPLQPETYRVIAKEYLAHIYREQEKQEPSSITLNLASHQLMDDIEGWTKLNYKI